MLNISLMIHACFTFYTFILLIRLLSSWFPSAQSFKAIRWIHYYTEPYLKIFRKIIPPVGMMDFSPLVAFLALRIMEKMLLTLIS